MEDHVPRFVESFGELPDPRRDNGRLRHDLVDMVAIALCAVLCGAESFVAMEEFAVSKELWLQQRLGLGLSHGIPSHHTFGRLFSRLDPGAFERCFVAWTQALHTLTQGEVIALDGKSLRRSFDTATGQSALHLVSAWASHNRLVLAQQVVESKSNEMTAVPALLERLDIHGCVVTTDALNTQKNIAGQIVKQGGNYVLALKANHGLLYQLYYEIPRQEMADFFDWMRQRKGGLKRLCEDSIQTQEWQHGRHEVRRCFCLEASEADWPLARRQWPGLASLVCVETQRRLVTTGPKWRRGLLPGPRWSGAST